MNCSELKSQLIIDSADNCENHGLFLSLTNTIEKINNISNQIIQCIDMNDPENNMLQVGLNFTNGKFVWSDGDLYIPEKHDQLFSKHFKPICQFDHAITYLDPKSEKLFNFCVDKHLKKLCSVIDTIAEENVDNSGPSKSYLWLFVVLVILVLIILSSVWYFKFRRPPATVELIRVTKLEDKEVKFDVSPNST